MRDDHSASLRVGELVTEDVYCDVLEVEPIGRLQPQYLDAKHDALPANVLASIDRLFGPDRRPDQPEVSCFAATYIHC